jgi:hypothetical protein
VQERIDRLIAQAVDHFAAAETALRAGDLGTYQSEVEQAKTLIEQANQLASGQATPAGSPTPSPSP